MFYDVEQTSSICESVSHSALEELGKKKGCGYLNHNIKDTMMCDINEINVLVAV